jgi:Ig-like domain CHU_C associated
MKLSAITNRFLDLPFSQTNLVTMFKFTQPSKKLRLVSSRLGSLLLLLQRTPLVQWLLPEAPLASGIGASKVTQWTIAAVAGLGAYDTVAGATSGGAVINQVTPKVGSYAVSAILNKSLNFTFRATGSKINPVVWTIRGTLPAGLVHSNVMNKSLDSITGVPTETGDFPITITSWAHADFTGSSVSQDFTITVSETALELPKITLQPSATNVAKGKKATLRVLATSAASYQWYKGKAGITSNPVRGATAAKFTTPTLKANTSYWVRVTNAAGSTNSKTVLVKVK